MDLTLIPNYNSSQTPVYFFPPWFQPLPFYSLVADLSSDLALTDL